MVMKQVMHQNCKIAMCTHLIIQDDDDIMVDSLAFSLPSSEAAANRHGLGNSGIIKGRLSNI